MLYRYYLAGVKRGKYFDTGIILLYKISVHKYRVKIHTKRSSPSFTYLVCNEYLNVNYQIIRE